MVNPTEDKLMWTLVRPEAPAIAEFQQYVLEDLAVAAGGLVPGVTSVRVTLQEPNTFSGAIVNVGGDDRRVDAVLQITSSGFVRGDRPRELGAERELRPRPGMAGPRRRRCTTRAPTCRSGRRVPSSRCCGSTSAWTARRPSSTAGTGTSTAGTSTARKPRASEPRRTAARHLRGADRARWYIQNRVLEPDHADGLGRERVRRSSWAPASLPGPGERYNPKDGMGEESFDRWPPRVVQGSSYRVL